MSKSKVLTNHKQFTFNIIFPDII